MFPGVKRLIIRISLDDEKVSSLKSSQAITRSSFSPTLSGTGLLGDSLCGPVVSFVLSPSPSGALAAYWQYMYQSCYSLIFCAMCWPTALNYGDRNPLCLPCDLHCYFWKIPNSQGALCFPSLCPKENKSLRVSNYNSWMEPQNTRQNPHCPESPCTAFALTGIIGATAVLMPFGHAFQHRPS